MVSRKAAMIALATSKAAKLAERHAEGSRSRYNEERISTICRALLQRKSPVKPTASLVAERGGIEDEDFPELQTIYNSYREVLAVWRKAYFDIRNVDAEDPIGLDDVRKIDTSVMDSSTAAVVEQLKAIVLELVQRVNVLKKFQDDAVTTPAHGVVQELDADRIIGRLRDWLATVADGFDLDEIGLRVSRKNIVGSRIMRRDLFDELVTFVEDYGRIRRAQDAAR